MGPGQNGDGFGEVRELGFEDSGAMDRSGKRIRNARFIERSLLPVGAACMVASGVREALSALFGAEVRVRVSEPVLPSPQAWRTIAGDASVYHVPGRTADTAMLLRPSDALALVGSAFGEPPAQPRPLSAIERTVLERTLGALAVHVSTLCGKGDGAPRFEPGTELGSYSTYFELLIEGASAFRIAIALSREPQSVLGTRLMIADLEDVEVEVAARVHLAPIDAETLLGLEPGAFLPMMNTMAPFDARAGIAGWTLAYGEGGVSGGCYAFVLDGREPLPVGSE